MVPIRADFATGKLFAVCLGLLAGLLIDFSLTLHAICLQQPLLVPVGNGAAYMSEQSIEQTPFSNGSSPFQIQRREDTNNSMWCPEAICMNSDVCSPCNRRFLIIIASGRSGSTTLTYMMDSLPGVRMSGENNNQLKALKVMVDNIRFNPNFLQGTDKQHAWGHNNIVEGAYACPVQHMIETINPPSTTDGRVLEDDTNVIVGFKTIRFVHDADESNDEKLVAFVKEMFPCSRIVVNIRSDTESLRNSRANTFHDGQQLEAVQDETRRLVQVAKMFGDSAFLLDSTNWTSDVSHMNEVVSWLGFDKSCHFNELLEFNTKGDGNQAGRTSIELNPSCQYIGS